MPSTILQQSYTPAPLSNADPIVPPHHCSEVIEEQQAMEDIVSLSNEERERKIFNQDVHNFMAEIGKPLSKIPIMGYKELDLFQLFKEVMSYGGFNEVVKNVGTWSKIWKRLGNFDPSITDSSFRLKKNYERYLLEYEFKCFPDRRQQNLEHEKHIQLKKAHLSLSGERPHSPTSPNSGNSSSSDSPFSQANNSGSSSPEISHHASYSSSFRSLKKSKKNKKLMSITYSEPERVNGAPKMPLLLGDLTVERLGYIVPRHPYITEKHVWPVSFCSTTYFQSMINPHQVVKYISEIVDAGDKPQFVVTAEDDSSNPILAHSPSAAWKIVLKRVARAEDPRKVKVSINGSARFGLTHPVVASLIRELANYPELKVPSSPESEGRKKRKQPIQSYDNSLTHDSDEMVCEDSLNLLTVQPAQKLPKIYEDRFSARAVSFESRDEMDDLESAVATLEAMKYCITN